MVAFSYLFFIVGLVSRLYASSLGESPSSSSSDSVDRSTESTSSDLTEEFLRSDEFDKEIRMISGFSPRQVQRSPEKTAFLKTHSQKNEDAEYNLTGFFDRHSLNQLLDDMHEGNYRKIRFVAKDRKFSLDMQVFKELLDFVVDNGTRKHLNVQISSYDCNKALEMIYNKLFMRTVRVPAIHGKPVSKKMNLLIGIEKGQLLSFGLMKFEASLFDVLCQFLSRFESLQILMLKSPHLRSEFADKLVSTLGKLKNLNNLILSGKQLDEEAILKIFDEVKGRIASFQIHFFDVALYNRFVLRWKDYKLDSDHRKLDLTVHFRQ